MAHMESPTARTANCSVCPVMCTGSSSRLEKTRKVYVRPINWATMIPRMGPTTRARSPKMEPSVA